VREWERGKEVICGTVECADNTAETDGNIGTDGIRMSVRRRLKV